jgi:hypothetical protein
MRAFNLPKDAIKGVVAVSGRYRLGPNEGPFKAYVPTAEAERLASPIEHIVDPIAQIVIAVGDTESAYLEPSRLFESALVSRSMRPKLVVLPHHDHQQTADALGDPQSPLFKATMELLR